MLNSGKLTALGMRGNEQSSWEYKIKVKLYKSGIFIEASCDIFLKWNNRVWYHEWGTSVILKKINHWNYTQNSLPINVDNNKYRMC